MEIRDRAGDVQGLVAQHLPDYRVDSVAHVGEGCHNIAYDVNRELIVRFSKEPDATRRAARVDQEARLLATVAGFSPLPVPEPVFTAAGQGCLAYFKVPGVPLLDLPESHRSSHAPSIATTLGEFLTAINAAPVELMAELVGVDDAPLDEWRRDAAQLYATIAGEVPAVRRRPAESFLAAPTPAGGYPLVFSHNDLGIEHVLVDPARWTVSGIIDWSDAAIVDPAYDLGLLHRDLGPAALAAAISHYRVDAGEIGKLHERAVFYARCSVFEDLAYGIETGHGAFVDKSLAAMGWLFPA